jgi:hypothetical protein
MTDETPEPGVPVEPTEPTEPVEEAEPAVAPAAAPVIAPVIAPGVDRLRRARAVRRVVTGLASATAALALVVGAVLADDLLPRPEPVPAVAADLDVPPAAATVVCPGPLRLPTEPEPGGDLTYDPQFDPSPQDSVTGLVAVAEGTASLGVRALGGEAEATPSGALAAVVPDVAAGTVVVAPPEVDGAPQVAAAVGTLTPSGDLRGLTAATCGRPGAELWLVGGSTTLGSSARLVLQNPGATAVTVGLDLWGPSGPVELAGAPQFLVPPRQERVVLLEGLAAEERRIVVRLTAAGGLVTAHLQDSALRGVVPAGVDQVVPGVGPGTRQVLTGVVVPATEPGTADTAQLRLLATEESTTASVTLQGPDGTVALPGLATVALDAGAVLDIPLAGLPAGTWTVVVDADAPVAAGALVTSGTGVGAASESSTAPLDRAWVPASAPVPSGGSATVVVPRDAAGPAGADAGDEGSLEDAEGAEGAEGTDGAAGTEGAEGADGADVPGTPADGPMLSRAVVLALVDPPAGQDVRATADVTLDLLDGAGEVAGAVEVTADRGSTLRLEVPELIERAGLPATADVVAVRARAEGGSVVLGVVLTASTAQGGLVSVLAATPEQVAREALRVDVR